MNPVQDEWRESSHREKDHMVEAGVLGSNIHIDSMLEKQWTWMGKAAEICVFISVSFSKELGLGGW